MTPKMQNDWLEVSEADIGLGVFARVDIPAGSVCSFLSGELIHFDDTTQQEGANAIQIGQDLYIYPLFPLRFINHSCSPNAGIRNDMTLIAIEEIAAGEEVCFDYSTTMFERHFTMKCKCGSRNCRGVINDFDLLPQTTQNRYLSLGVVQSFIAQRFSKSDPCAGLIDAIRTECGQQIGTSRLPLNRLLNLGKPSSSLPTGGS